MPGTQQAPSKIWSLLGTSSTIQATSARGIRICAWALKSEKGSVWWELQKEASHSWLCNLGPGKKDDAVKVLHSICQQIWKTQQWPQDWKRSVCIPIANKGNTKECSNYRTIAFIAHASKVMLKILQARLQQNVNRELPDVQAGFRKGRGTRDQIANICSIIKKAREIQKNIYFCFTDYAKTFLWITINCGKFWRRWEYQNTWPASWEISMQVRKP